MARRIVSILTYNNLCNQYLMESILTLEIDLSTLGGMLGDIVRFFIYLYIKFMVSWKA